VVNKSRNLIIRENLGTFDNPQGRDHEMGIPLVRATALYPMMTAMNEINVPSAKLLDEARIPQIDCCNPNDWICTERILHLDNLVCRKGGVPSLAFLAANAASIADMGEFGKHVQQAPTLKAALDRYCDKQIYYRSSSNCYLIWGQNYIWFCRQTKGFFRDGFEQLELYVLAEMITVVRLAAGPNWWPGKLYFQSHQSPSFQDAAEDAGTKLAFNQEFGGFAIPRSMLVRPLRYKDASRLSENISNDAAEFWKPASDDFVGSLQQIMPCYMRDGDIKIELVAEILGFSIRSLQRQLSQRGMCYRDLVEQIRFQTALKLLRQRELSLIDISINLGYGHAASFTRAFRRWAGTSPKKFRAQMVLEYRGSIA